MKFLKKTTKLLSASVTYELFGQIFGHYSLCRTVGIVRTTENVSCRRNKIDDETGSRPPPTSEPSNATVSGYPQRRARVDYYDSCARTERRYEIWSRISVVESVNERNLRTVVTRTKTVIRSRRSLRIYELRPVAYLWKGGVRSYPPPNPILQRKSRILDVSII